MLQAVGGNYTNMSNEVVPRQFINIPHYFDTFITTTSKYNIYVYCGWYEQSYNFSFYYLILIEDNLHE